ncbi:MAG TPA: sigma-70 family RNA polymerase sigma factor [Burkholderiales bacterium]
MNERDPAPEQLIARMARGEERALAEFYDAYHARVYAFALKLVRDRADAAEVLNEVMLEVWRGARQYAGRSRALTWVFGIAHHKAIDRVRRRRDRFEDDAALAAVADDAPAAVDVIAIAEDRDRLRDCLERLSEAHRLVLHLAFFDDLPYPEIAEIIGCPLGTVKTRVFHAKQLLKQCLAGLEARAPSLPSVS